MVLAKVRDKIKKNKKELFWVWIGYQTVKGIITTSVIWIPLILSLT